MRPDDFHACIIIPVYNHAKKVVEVIENLKRYQISCIMIDDGSEPDCCKVLEQLSFRYDWIELVRFSENHGKGAAVCFALKKAGAMGFTHALQVDADGQHDLSDIPKFLKLAELYPYAVISGRRIYTSVPKNRRYGRMVTDFWVYINTLSFSIKDSMCGYRLYPLQLTEKTLKQFSIGKRMDFDTDIIVKMFWLGAEIKHIPTHVIYGDDNISHFDLYKDNLRISFMHTRLFLGMLIRFPSLIIRLLLVKKSFH